MLQTDIKKKRQKLREIENLTVQQVIDPNGYALISIDLNIDLHHNVMAQPVMLDLKETKIHACISCRSFRCPSG